MLRMLVGISLSLPLKAMKRKYFIRGREVLRRCFFQYGGRTRIHKPRHICCILIALLPAFGLTGAYARQERALEIYDRSDLVFGEKFTLGPFARAIMPVPVELTIGTKDGAAAASTAALAAIEADVAGNMIGQYPCWPLAGTESGAQRVVFIPFADNDRKAWPASRERHFIIRPEASLPVARDRLTVNVASNVLTIKNRYYSIALAAPESGLSGDARVIREIGFGDGKKVFRPYACLSELTIADKKYFWCFDPDVPPTLKQFGDQMAMVGYGGFFQAGKEKLEGVAWRMTLTFYAALPLVKAHFERRQNAPAQPFQPCQSQSILQMQFDASNPEVPFQNMGYIQRSAYERGGDLLAADGPGALLAILLPDGKTFGTRSRYYRPGQTTYAFLRAEWETLNTIRSKNSYIEIDVRDFYLLATDEVSVREDLGAYWWSLFRFLDIDDRIKVRRLFDGSD